MVIDDGNRLLFYRTFAFYRNIFYYSLVLLISNISTTNYVRYILSLVLLVLFSHLFFLG